MSYEMAKAVATITAFASLVTGVVLSSIAESYSVAEEYKTAFILERAALGSFAVTIASIITRVRLGINTER